MRTIDDIMLFWAIVVAALMLALLYLVLAQYARHVIQRPRQWDFHDVHLPHDE